MRAVERGIVLVASSEHNMDTRYLVEQWIEGMRSGDFLETFERLVADDVVVLDFGEDMFVSNQSVRSVDGKSTRKAALLRFYMNSEFQVTDLQSVIVEGNRAAIELSANLATSGVGTSKIHLVALQTWSEGRIILQHNYIAGDRSA